ALARMGSVALFFARSGNPPALPSFPTRRSSDLVGSSEVALGYQQAAAPLLLARVLQVATRHQLGVAGRLVAGDVSYQAAFAARRSEEHTSELQSRENLVCRLLLEKKNTCRSRVA